MDSIILMDGKKVSQEFLQTQKHIDNTLRPPCLCIITVGNDMASKVYIRNKIKACHQCNINVIQSQFDINVTYRTLEFYIKELNSSPNVDGIIIQQPLPKQLKGIEQLVLPEKDVDGFTNQNLGYTLTNQSQGLQACTPQGIMYLLKYYDVPLEGKTVVIIGRSNIVGKPLIGLLLQENATVISCNSYTQNLTHFTSQADVLITAIGKPKMISMGGNLLDNCYCIVDVGMNKDENGKLCGDVDFRSVYNSWQNSQLVDKDFKIHFITPVPGGVGPMTVAVLIHNVNLAYHRNINKQLLIKDRGSISNGYDG